MAGGHASQAGDAGELTRAQVPRVRGRRVDQGRDQPGDLGEFGLELGQRSRVGGRELRELLPRGAQVVVQQQRRPVGTEVERRAGRVDGNPALDQAKVTPDGFAQHAQHVGAGRGPKAGSELLRDRAAADEPASLEHHGPQTRLGEVERCDEAVVAAANDRDVPILRP